MKLSSIVGEAWRNLSSGTTRALLLALLFSGSIGALAASDVSAILSIHARATQFRDSGAATRIIAAEDAVIDPKSCDDLAKYDAVEASGGLTEATPVSLTALPGSKLTAYRVTPGFASVLNVNHTASTGVWVSDQLASNLKVAVGDTLETSTGPMQIAGTFSWASDGRDLRIGSALLIPDKSSAAVTECWATTWPISASSDDSLFAAAKVTAGVSKSPILTQANRSFGLMIDPNAEFHHRLTRIAPGIAGLLGLIIGYSAIAARRLQFAGAMHAGATRPDVVATGLIETAIWSLAGGLLAVAAVVGYVVASSAELAPLLVTSLKVVLAGVGSAIMGATISLLLIRERHLFRYFKDR